MSQNVGTKLCSANGCQTQFSDNGTHNCCPSHSSCYDSDLAEYQPHDCHQCQEWISLLLSGPSEALQQAEVLREKLTSWIAKMQKLRRGRHLPGSVVRDQALRELVFGSDSVVGCSSWKNSEEIPPREFEKSKRPPRRRVIVSDDSDGSEVEGGPPEKRNRVLHFSESEDDEPFEVASVSSERASSAARHILERTDNESRNSERRGSDSLINSTRSYSESRISKQLDFENRDSERADSENRDSERAYSESRCSGRAESESHYSERADSESRCSERADSESRCSERADSESRCSERADSESRCSKQADSESRSERADSESRCSDRADSESRCSDRADSESRCSERADSENRCSKRVDSENRYSERADSESRDSERADFESRCSERADSENHNSKRADSKNHNSERADSEDPYSEIAHSENGYSEIADFKNRCSKRAYLENLYSKPVDSKNRSSKQADSDNFFSKRAGSESLYSKRADNENRNSKQDYSEYCNSKRSPSENRYSKRVYTENRYSEPANLENRYSKQADSENRISERADSENLILERLASQNGNLQTVEIPSMEEVAKTMNWLVQSVGSIQNMLLQKQVIKYENGMHSSALNDAKSFGDIQNSFSVNNEKASERGNILISNPVKGDISPLETAHLQEKNTEFGFCHSGPRKETRKRQEENDGWVPLPEDFKLDRNGPVPRVKVPVGKEWMTLSSERCKVHFHSTIPFIRYVADEEEDETVPSDKCIFEKDKASKAFTDSAQFTINQSGGAASQKVDYSIGARNHNDNLLVMPEKDEDAFAKGYDDDLNTLWTKFIEGKSSTCATSLSFLNIIFSRENMTELHAALSAPQIGVEDTARMLRVKLRKLPVASYREEKGARAQLLRLINSIQAFQSLMASFKTTMANGGDRETSILISFSKALETPMLTLEGAFRYALMEFYRVRKTLRQKVFRGLKLNLQVSELIRSSPFSEDLFHPVAVNEFLSQLRQQNIIPSDFTKKRAQKKVIFSKKYFALPKKKIARKEKMRGRKLHKQNRKTTISKQKSIHKVKSKRGTSKSDSRRVSVRKEKSYKPMELGNSEQEFSEEY